MRAEKQFLVEEVGTFLDKSDYALLAEYTGLTVADVAELRGNLAELGAEYHVVKNTILSIAAKEREIPELDELLKGQVAVVTGGDAVANVVKAVDGFFKNKKKGSIKGAILAKKIITTDRVESLKSLPTLEGARGQFLALLNTPATSLVRLLNAPAQQLANVLNAKKRKDEEAA